MKHFSCKKFSILSVMLSLLSPIVVPLHASKAVLFEQSPEGIQKLDDGNYLVDFGKVSFGNIYLVPSAEMVGEVVIHFGEAMKNERINRKPPGSVRYQVQTANLDGKTKVVVAPNPDARNTKVRKPPHDTAILTPPEWGVVMPFRWVEVEGWRGEFTKDMIIRRSAFSEDWDDDAADFKTSSDLLNRIWDLCKYSIKATTFAGVYVDGDRERIPYEADAYLNQLSHYYVDHDKQVARDTFNHFFKHPTWPTEWASHLVFMLHADYMETGDLKFLAENYEKTKTKLLLERRGEDNLIASVRGQSRPDLIDWPPGERDGFKFTERNTVINAFHLRSLFLMSEMANALGKSAEADEYMALYESGLQAFQETFFNEEAGLYFDGVGTEHMSFHANMFPLAFHLVPEEHQKKIADWLVSRGMRCSVYAAQYLMEALFEYGQAEGALDLITADNDRSWKHMVNSGTTITWEAWDQKYKPNQDWNHAWGAVPANIFPRYILGVNAIEPGFKKARVKPHPVDITYAKGKIPTVKGPVFVQFNNFVGKPFQLSVELPEGMTAEVEVPLPGGKGDVKYNGKMVASVKKDGYALIQVGAGQHTFETTSTVLAPVEKPRPEIISATYGSSEKFVDVTSELLALEMNEKGVVLFKKPFNNYFGDPHRKVVKVLTVTYKLAGEEKTQTFKENRPVVLK